MYGCLRVPSTAGTPIRLHRAAPVNVENMGGTTQIRITALTRREDFQLADVQAARPANYVERCLPVRRRLDVAGHGGPFEPESLAMKIAPAIATAPAQQPTMPSLSS